MVGLKSFLYELGPLLGTTGIALYERQRILVNLGVVEAVPGRGPGSGVPLTADNIAAMIISVLAADAPSEIDQTVAALCNATSTAKRWTPEISKKFRDARDARRGVKPTAKLSVAVGKALLALAKAAAAEMAPLLKELQEAEESEGRPVTFKEALGRVLSGQVEKPINVVPVGVRVLRPAQGQIDYMLSPAIPISTVRFGVSGADAPRPTQIIAEISQPVLDQLKDLTCSALKAEAEEDDE